MLTRLKYSKNKNPKQHSTPRIISDWFNAKSHPEKHYCELIMLSTSWRNEENDLIGAYSSYQEHYIFLKNEIGKKMKKLLHLNLNL